MKPVAEFPHAIKLTAEEIKLLWDKVLLYSHPMYIPYSYHPISNILVEYNDHDARVYQYTHIKAKSHLYKLQCKLGPLL